MHLHTVRPMHVGGGCCASRGALLLKSVCDNEIIASPCAVCHGDEHRKHVTRHTSHITCPLVHMRNCGLNGQVGSLHTPSATLRTGTRRAKSQVPAAATRRRHSPLASYGQAAPRSGRQLAHVPARASRAQRCEEWNVTCDIHSSEDVEKIGSMHPEARRIAVRTPAGRVRQLLMLLMLPLTTASCCS